MIHRVLENIPRVFINSHHVLSPFCACVGCIFCSAFPVAMFLFHISFRRASCSLFSFYHVFCSAFSIYCVFCSVYSFFSLSFFLFHHVGTCVWLRCRLWRVKICWSHEGYLHDSPVSGNRLHLPVGHVSRFTMVCSDGDER